MTGWTSVDIPAGFASEVSRHPPDPGMPSGRDWLDRLPRLVTEALAAWELRTDGPTRWGRNAVVLPVRRADESTAALKVGWPHREAAHEHLALRAWAGAGAVRLLAADPSRGALLLERVDPLSTHLERLSVRVDEAMAGPAAGVGRLLPRRLLVQGRALCTELAARPGVDARLVHTDLHGQNVLHRPTTGQWVVIDPKPMAAIPEFAVAPALWNRWPEVVGSGHPRAHLQQRLETVCDHARLDADLARACTITRMLGNALWLLRAPGPQVPAEVTVCVTVLKAMLPS
ncbi:MAG: aminoglycoside resistance protein [Actinobacteria bacterium]|nr:aminoglycoside resistance protein [Actinomycetota bacterium]